jgi:hypothetical protein
MMPPWPRSSPAPAVNEQPRADLGVGVPVAGHPRDLGFLRGRGEQLRSRGRRFHLARTSIALCRWYVLPQRRSSGGRAPPRQYRNVGGLAVPTLPSRADTELHGQRGKSVSVRIVPLRLSISNAYLLLGDRPVLVDTGRPGVEQRLLDSLDQHSIAPAGLALVVLTHGHTDHAGAVEFPFRGISLALGDLPCQVRR